MIEGTTLPFRPTPEVVFAPLPRKGGGVKGKKPRGLGWGPWIPWIPRPFTPAAACVAMASDFRDGGVFFLTGTSFPGNTG